MMKKSNDEEIPKLIDVRLGQCACEINLAPSLGQKFQQKLYNLMMKKYLN